MTRTSKLLFLPVLLLQASFFLYVSQHRLIDGDEGFYLLASRLVMQHRAPYLDFFYTQAPLLPYIFAAWLKLAGVSWYSARALCALITTLIGGLMYLHVSRETGKWLAGACAVLLYAASSLIFAWYPIVKTFPLAVLFLFPAYMILGRLSSATPGWLLALSGALFGLSVDTRSYIVGVLPLLLWWIWRSRREGSIKPIASFMGGFAVGLLPSLVLFFASPDAFLFNNLGFHALRDKGGLIGRWGNKLKVVTLTLSGDLSAFQFTVTSLTALAGVVFLRPRRNSSLLALLIAVVLGMVSLLPTPTMVQYFSLIMPFLIVAAVCSTSDLLAQLQSPLRVKLVAAVCLVLVAAFVGSARNALKNYLSTGRGVPGIFAEREAHNWTLQHVADVSQAVDLFAQPGEAVISFWPGYLFTTRARPLPGYENDFGMYVAPFLTPEKRKQYHILTAIEMFRGFAVHDARIVVIGNEGTFVGGPDPRAAAQVVEMYGYQLVSKVGDTAFYECCQR